MSHRPGALRFLGAMAPRFPSSPPSTPPGTPAPGADFVIAVAPGPRTLGLGEILGVILRQLQDAPPATDATGRTPGGTPPWTPGAHTVHAEVRELEDLIQLLPGRGSVVADPGTSPGDAHPCGRLVLDGEHLPLEDVGLVRRFLKANPGWSAVCLGLDPRGTIQRALEDLPRIGWRPWPPDLEQLRALARIPDPLPLVYGRDGTTLVSPTEVSGPQAQELIEITRRLEARILADRGSDPSAQAAHTDASLRAEVVRLGLLCRELGMRFPHSTTGTGAPDTVGVQPPVAPRPAPPPRPADDDRGTPAPGPDVAEPVLAYRTAGLPEPAAWDDTDISFEEVRGRDDAGVSHPGVLPPQEADASSRFAAQRPAERPDAGSPPGPGSGLGEPPKTPSPPGPDPAPAVLGPRELLPGDGSPADSADGDEPAVVLPVDLAALLEERLASLAVRSPDGPRFQYAGDPCLWVEGGGAALARVVEDLLEIARLCAGNEGLVRVRAGHRASRGGRQVDALMSFPVGPLEGLDRTRILTPGGLRDALPSIGQRDLGQAAARIRRQGGALGVQLDRGGRLRVAFRLRAADVEAPEAPTPGPGAPAAGPQGSGPRGSGTRKSSVASA